VTKRVTECIPEWLTVLQAVSEWMSDGASDCVSGLLKD
jgi:hypothetical protein